MPPGRRRAAHRARTPPRCSRATRCATRAKRTLSEEQANRLRALQSPLVRVIGRGPRYARSAERPLDRLQRALRVVAHERRLAPGRALAPAALGVVAVVGERGGQRRRVVRGRADRARCRAATSSSAPSGSVEIDRHADELRHHDHARRALGRARREHEHVAGRQERLDVAAHVRREAHALAVAARRARAARPPRRPRRRAPAARRRRRCAIASITTSLRLRRWKREMQPATSVSRPGAPLARAAARAPRRRS